MRHGNKINQLGRSTSHRHAMMANMASSLIKSKRIFTTLAKAKALRKYIEPLVTKSKADSTHSRRVVFSYLQNKDSVKELFGSIATKVADRPGGYTRILKTGVRPGDNAEMCMIEFVDFNESLGGGKISSKVAAASKRTRRGGAKKDVKNAIESKVETQVEAKDEVVENNEPEIYEEIAPDVMPESETFEENKQEEK
ncbi:MAG: 50S ribosomal protein L17 [Bacteroidetes bacterium]|nr:50S ribosomal protein L17 [Bacteroidota bacterium]